MIISSSTKITYGTGTVEGQALSSLLSSRLVEGAVPLQQDCHMCRRKWEWGATKNYSHHSGSLLPGSVCWVLFFSFRKQKSTVISIDSPSHLEPVNNAVVSCLGSRSV